MLKRCPAITARGTSQSLARLWPDRRGVVAIITGLLGLPMVLAVGISVDYARMAQCQTAMQDAVDNAALAGATVYNTSSQSSNAATVAARYFNAAPLPSMLTVGTPSVSAASGTTNFNGTSYNVTVTASATIVPAFLQFVKSSFTLTATATASNPVVTISVSTGSFGSSAADWDAIWLYAVPMSNGQPVYSSIPSQSSFYEIGSNCNKSSSSNYSSSSRCVGNTGATVSSSQTMPTITATQPIGFALENMTYGLYTSSTTGTNYYGSPAGHINWFYSAYEEIATSPSQNTNYTYTTTTTTNRTTTTTSTTTTYPTTSSSTTPNCSLIVAQVTTSTTPTSPPSSGKCFSVTNTASGYPYAAMSCATMNGNTYVYWWNDLGGSSDDKDYNDAHYIVSCTVSTGSGSGNTQVVLTQ